MEGKILETKLQLVPEPILQCCGLVWRLEPGEKIPIPVRLQEKAWSLTPKKTWGLRQAAKQELGNSGTQAGLLRLGDETEAQLAGSE